MSEFMIPLFDRVLLRRQTAQHIGSIIVPKEAQKRYASLRCTVVLLGPDCALRAGIQPGDEVLISRYGGDWLNKDGKPITDADEAEYFIVQEKDLICVFKEVESERGSTSRDIDREIDRINRSLATE